MAAHDDGGLATVMYPGDELPALSLLLPSINPSRTITASDSQQGGAEIKLELSVGKTRTDEEVRSNALTGPRLAFGDAVVEDSGSRTSSGEYKKYSTNSRVPSNLKDSSSSRMQAGPSRNRVKLEGSTSVTALSIPNPQRLRTLPSKHPRNSNAGSKKELRDTVVHRTLRKINEDWKEKMLEASDEVLKFLNKDYHGSPHKRGHVHN
uniref:Uncharacterized protein n=1 Tax=Zea mays TaxID=4577 RepID=A0A804R4V4_MAIZE